MDSTELLAHRYAIAFLNVYQHSLTVPVIKRLAELIKFLESHKQSLFYVKVSSIPEIIKRDVLGQLFEQFELKTPAFFALLTTLAQHKRLFLSLPILHKIYQDYEKRMNISEFVVATATQLNQDQITTIQKFLEKQIQQAVDLTVTLDRSLIAGIRIQSDTLLWEHSIRKQLKDIHGN